VRFDLLSSYNEVESKRRSVLEKLKENKHFFVESWKSKYEKAREHAVKSLTETSMEFYTQYAEKMIKTEREKVEEKIYCI